MVLKKEDNELIQISVPTKKINLEVTESKTTEIILRPFKQRHFATAIAIINKYFDEFNSVRQNYLRERKAILDKYEDAITRELALAELDAGFNEGMEIAKAILAVGDGVAEDIKTIVSMSIYKATSVVRLDDGTERQPTDPDLDDLTWGECLVLLGSVVGLNMDFFNQNSKAMNLISVLSQEPESPKTSDPAPPTGARERARKQQDGEKSSPNSSMQTTAIAK